MIPNSSPPSNASASDRRPSRPIASTDARDRPSRHSGEERVAGGPPNRGRREHDERRTRREHFAHPRDRANATSAATPAAAPPTRESARFQRTPPKPTRARGPKQEFHARRVTTRVRVVRADPLHEAGQEDVGIADQPRGLQVVGRMERREQGDPTSIRASAQADAQSDRRRTTRAPGRTTSRAVRRSTDRRRPPPTASATGIHAALDIRHS